MDKKLFSIITRHTSEQEENSPSFLKKLLIFFAFLLFFWFITLFMWTWWILSDLPSMEEIRNIQTSEASIIYDRNWNELYTVHWDENRTIIPFNKIKNETIYAVITLEDVNFFEHGWVDMIWILRAVLWEFWLISYKWWGSTLTQQFVKNKFLSNERSYIRKIKEMILSAQIENTYTKEEIITMYLNQIPFWANIYWIEQASNKFFWKNASDLDLAESTIIASVPNATSYYSPYWEHKRTLLKWISLIELEEKWIKNYDELIENFWKEIISYWLLPSRIGLYSWTTIIDLPWRSSYALEVMEKYDFIDSKQREEAMNILLSYEFQEFQEKIKAPHFVMYIREILKEKYWEQILNKWWFKIISTLDLSIQEKAEEIVKNNAEKNSEKYEVSNQALLSVNTKNWEIYAMVWSKDFFNKDIDWQVNVTRMKRLAWSIFKPIAYTAFMLSWYAPSSVLFDVETNFWNWGIDYIPKNYDWEFMWPISVRQAIWNSRNIPAIKAWIISWVQKVYDIAKTFWIKFVRPSDWYGSSISIWTAEVTAQEILEAYLVFANNWKRIETQSILKIISKDWVILEELNKNIKYSTVLDPQVAYLMTDILSDKESRWPWWNSFLQLKDRINAVKTWTSNKAVKKWWKWFKSTAREWLEIAPLDWWTIWFTPQYATVVWSWNNDWSPASMKFSWFHTSARTWNDFMTFIHKDLPAEKFEKPNWIKYINVSRISWKLPNKDTPKWLITSWIFGDINSPKEYDNSLKFINIDSVSKKLPTPFTPEDAIEKAAILNVHSERPNDSNWEDPVRTWLKNEAFEYLDEYWIDSVLSESPVDSDDVHTRENTKSKPEIKIISPKSWSLVSRKWFSVMPDVSSKYWVVKVEYYIDWNLADTSYTYPYIWKIKAENWWHLSLKEHVLKVKVFDSLYNTSNISFTVKIWNDTENPYTEIVKPSKWQSLIAWSSYEIRTLTYDVWSDIDRVTFYLNNKRIWDVKKAPFWIYFSVPKKVGEYNIKVIAFDQAWNESENEILINSIENTENIDEWTVIKFLNKLSIDYPNEIQININNPNISNIEKIELIWRQELISEKTDEFVISTISKFNNVWVFYTSWSPISKWKYEIFTKEYYKSKKVLKSKRYNVEM